MKILAREHELPGTPSEPFHYFAQEEARKAWDLHQAGLIRELHFRADQHSAVLVLECASTEAARKILDEMPFVREGFNTFELIRLEAYSGFDRLFAEGKDPENKN